MAPLVFAFVAAAALAAGGVRLKSIICACFGSAYHAPQEEHSCLGGGMAVDARDEIWNATYDTYYSTYFEEMVCDALLDRWQRLDEVTKVLVAITATGSAVAGWALWEDPNFKVVWSILAGLGALLAIVHTSLDVSGRLKAHGDNRRLFASLRIDLETFRYRMQIDSEFPVPEFTNKLVELRERYGQAIDRGRNDIMLTDSLRISVQNELDERIADKVLPKGG